MYIVQGVARDLACQVIVKYERIAFRNISWVILFEVRVFRMG